MDEDSSSSEECIYDGKYYLTRLIKLLKESLKVAESYLPSRKKSSNKMLNNYMTAYQRIVDSESCSFDDDHAPIFSKMFYDNRKHFMGICRDDGFLCTCSLQAWYGESTTLKKKNLRLPISVCLSVARSMREKKSESLTEDPETDSQIMQATEYIIYGEIKYFLMKVIWFSIEDDCVDKGKLNDIIEELRLDTTLEDDDEDIPGHSMNGLVKSVAGMLGVNLDNKGKIEEVAEKMSVVMEDKEFTSGVKSAIDEVSSKPPASMGDCLKDVMDKLAPNMESMMRRNNVPPPGTISHPDLDRSKSFDTDGMMGAIRDILK